MTIAIDLTTYNALVDDDGSNTVGTLGTKAALLLNPVLTPVQTALTAVETAAKPGVSTITTTGNITALALPSGSGDLVVYLNNATLSTIQGIAAGLAGQRLTIFSIGAGQVDLSHQDAAATAALRLINCATSGKTSLAAGVGTASYVYDATAARWRLKEHEQGAAIAWTPAFKGSTSQTGQAHSAQTGFYTLRGNRVFIDANVSLSTLGTITGNVEIGELPYAVSGSIASTGGLSNWSSFTTAYVYLTGITITGSTRFRLQGLTAAATGVSNLAQANLAATTNITFSVNYLTT